MTPISLKKVLASLIAIPTIETPAPADVITVNSGWELSAGRTKVLRLGHIIFLSWVAKYTSTWNTATQLTMGTLNVGYRPLIEMNFASINTNGVIAPNGTLYVRNVCGSNMANAETSYTAILVVGG